MTAPTSNATNATETREQTAEKLLDALELAVFRYATHATTETSDGLSKARKELQVALLADHIVDANKMAPKLHAGTAVDYLINEYRLDTEHDATLKKRVYTSGDGKYQVVIERADAMSQHPVHPGRPHDYKAEMPSTEPEPVGWAFVSTEGTTMDLLPSRERALRAYGTGSAKNIFPVYRPIPTCKERLQVAHDPVTVAPCGVVEQIRKLALAVGRARTSIEADGAEAKLNAALAKLVTLPEPSAAARKYIQDGWANGQSAEFKLELAAALIAPSQPEATDAD